MQAIQCRGFFVDVPIGWVESWDPINVQKLSDTHAFQVGTLFSPLGNGRKWRPSAMVGVAMNRYYRELP